MMPGNYPLNIYRGDDQWWHFILWADAEKTTPVDLTGVTSKAEIRDRPSGTVVIQPATAITLPNHIYMSMSGILTRQLPASGRWDLQLTNDGNGYVSTILAGAVKVTGDITDSTPAADEPEPEAARTKGYLTEPAT